MNNLFCLDENESLKFNDRLAHLDFSLPTFQEKNISTLN